MGRYGIVPSSCINSFVDMPTRETQIKLPSCDVGGDAGGGRSGGVGGVEHGVGGVGFVVDCAE